MRTMVCAIGRWENDYIREWVEYYKNLGFTNVCLFDNNRDGEEYFEDVIGDYIDEGFVILKNYRNRRKCQCQVYKECYMEYNAEYDWIAFFDIDEFLTLTEHNDITCYLSQKKFNSFDAIHINWMIYTDNGLIENDGRKVLERLIEPVEQDKCVAYGFPENCHNKTIIRGGLEEKIEWNNCIHTPVGSSISCCNNIGEKDNINNMFSPYDFSEAYLRHFSTKTAKEYAKKMKRGFPDMTDVEIQGFKEMLIRTRFFRTNKVTQEKVNIFKEELGIDVSDLI